VAVQRRRATRRGAGLRTARLKAAAAASHNRKLDHKLTNAGWDRVPAREARLDRARRTVRSPHRRRGRARVRDSSMYGLRGIADVGRWLTAVPGYFAQLLGKRRRR